jgi:hypothetical protein
MNLLPQEEKENLKKGLKLRSLILISFIIAAFFLIGLVMLLPPYFLATGNLSKVSSENSLSGDESATSTKQFFDLPSEIDSKLKLLQSVNDGMPVMDSIFSIIKYLPTGVKLNSISFTKDQIYKDKTGIVILISGMASDRDSLVKFSTLLKESNLFSGIDVPVSSLTKDKNLPFSMNVFIENNK